MKSKPSPFAKILDSWPEARLRQAIDRAGPADIRRALRREQLFPEDLAALLSPAALPFLEDLAQEAHRLTRQHFGRTIGLYAPIYLSNICHSDCLYCGYALHSGSLGERRTLTPAEIRAECAVLAGHGFQNILLLTGEAPQVAPVEFLAQAVALAREYFPSVSVEIYALDQAGYRALVDRGLEGVTLYMETYHRETYGQVHRRGRKRDYDYRLEAMARAGRAGVRRLSIGALLGLYHWWADGFWMGLHARQLQKECWQSAISISFPRLRHAPGRFQVQHLPTDRELVQLMLALRLFLPEVGFNLSTRESAGLRDRLIPLGVTMMSAGSSTRPGGYAHLDHDTALEQFEIEDRRSPEEVVAAIRRAGYDPVWKDFDRAFVE
ncbi:MAG: 2-iminoacetate synthase ThiH [Deltaproteobacteria bacterium]|nr:2-iminoacetate synthase ThiH [Deltaproteobacteria bacterium]